MSIYSRCRRITQFFACVFIALLVHEVRGQEVASPDLAAKAEVSKFLNLPSEEAAREKSKAYIPTREDCAQVFAPDIAESVYNYFQEASASGEFVIGAPPRYSEVKLTAVSTDEINTWSGTAAKEMAGGWKRIRSSVLPGHTMYIVRFVKPGEDQGMRFDGLIKLKDKWVFFPKAWRHAQGVQAMPKLPESPTESAVEKDDNIAGMAPKQAAFELGWRMAVAATLHANQAEQEVVDEEFRKAKLLTMAMLGIELQELPALEPEANYARAIGYILNTPGKQMEEKLIEKYGPTAPAGFRAANRAVILLSFYFADKEDTLSASASSAMKRDLKTCGVPDEVTAKLFGLLEQNAPRSEVTKAIFAYHTDVFNTLGPFQAPK